MLLHTHLARDARAVEAPIEDVFALVADVDHWTDWTSGVRRSRLLKGPLRLGAGLMFVPNFLPLPVAAKVIAFEHNRLISWGVRTPIATLVHSFEFEALDARRTLVRHSEFAENLLALAMLPLRDKIREFDEGLSRDLQARFAEQS
ncbi:MAG: SRPBCC family protein [Polyangiales bacterium]